MFSYVIHEPKKHSLVRQMISFYCDAVMALHLAIYHSNAQNKRNEKHEISNAEIRYEINVVCGYDRDSIISRNVFALALIHVIILVHSIFFYYLFPSSF